MSGPITAGYFIAHGLVLLSVRAMEEAEALKGEYHAVLARQQEREAGLAQARRGQRNARLERIAAVRASAKRQSARLARLRAAAATLDGPVAALAAKPLPAAPGEPDDPAWSEYLLALEASAQELEAAVSGAAAAHDEHLRAVLGAGAAAPTIDDVLHAYVLERQRRPGLSAADATRFRTTAQRVLARLELPPGEPLPAELETLARSIVLAPTRERAEALAAELRLAVQRARDADARQAHDAAEARALLDALPEDAPAPLLRALEFVAAGAAPLDPALREAAQAALDEAAAARTQAEEAAATTVLQASLRDLGYEVEDIDATLFADGGTVHFRRPGWDRYFVRLRVDARERTVNFNVVRARGAEENAERRRQDALAEDRWCAEFPRLMQTLAARGLELRVTRRLGAGEVPVQVVDGALLPAIPDEADAPPTAAPRARPI
ncbi:MAG: hypothetical protein U1F10_13240 [Burkholderiales bacterium]